MPTHLHSGQYGNSPVQKNVIGSASDVYTTFADNPPPVSTKDISYVFCCIWSLSSCYLPPPRPSITHPSLRLLISRSHSPTSSPTSSATVEPMLSIAGLTMYRHGRTSPCRHYTGHLKPDATLRNVMWRISLPPTANQIPIRLRPACRQSLIRPFACIFIYLLPANDPLIFLCF